MRRFVDLHTHSLASDGSVRPAELVAMADAAGLLAVALTDHDTTAGLDAARREATRFPLLRFISGVEVSAAFPGGTLHILGLGIKESASTMKFLMRQMQEARADRNPRIIAKLQEMGMAIDMAEVAAQAGGEPSRIIGRLHIAHVMRAKGFVRTTAEAFDHYIGNGCPAFVDKERFAPRQVIGAIHDSGGLAVLAHPPQLRYGNRLQLERIARDLRDAGLDAVEAYHNDHTPQQVRECLDLARRIGLAVTGGSDFHGSAKEGVMLGRPRVSATMIERAARLLIGEDF